MLLFNASPSRRLFVFFMSYAERIRMVKLSVKYLTQGKRLKKNESWKGLVFKFYIKKYPLLRSRTKQSGFD